MSVVYKLVGDKDDFVYLNSLQSHHFLLKTVFQLCVKASPLTRIYNTVQTALQAMRVLIIQYKHMKNISFLYYK